MRIVCLSDTHGRHDEIEVPDGDVLVVAGDISRRGRVEEIEAVDAWLATLPHPHKVLVAGNHDFLFESDPARARALVRHATYLQDQGAVVGGLRVWGSPWQPRFFDWAFNLDRGAPLREKWAAIPDGLDLLITHGPPQGILDRTRDGRLVGCADLLEAVQRTRPRVHVFGHIHESAGREERDGTLFVNASSCTLSYVPSNPPIVVDLR